jgi:hypothetical protein
MISPKEETNERAVGVFMTWITLFAYHKGRGSASLV